MATGFEYIESTHHIALEGLSRVVDRILDVDLRREVIDDVVGRFEDFRENIVSTYVPLDEGQPRVTEELGDVLHTAIGKIVDDGQPFAILEKPLCQPSADEACPARY